MTVVACYVVYLALSIALTVWVGWTLHKNGRVFLVDTFKDREDVADSVNHLLLVGFYLINTGWVALALKYGTKPVDAVQALEFVATKVGCVLLVLGAMHFLNLFVFSRMRHRKLPANPFRDVQGGLVQPEVIRQGFGQY